MFTIGIDAHKETLTAVAVDEVGRELGQRMFPATGDGHFALVRWAARWPQRRFAVEDCRHLTRCLESDLLAAGETLVRVHTQLMAGERRGGRERGKSDPIDALAVARVALREPDLPTARPDGPARQRRFPQHSVTIRVRGGRINVGDEGQPSAHIRRPPQEKERKDPSPVTGGLACPGSGHSVIPRPLLPSSPQRP